MVLIYPCCESPKNLFYIFRTVKIKPHRSGKNKKRKNGLRWILAIVIPTIAFLISLVVSGKLINTNPGCTDAVVLSILQTGNYPARYKVKYAYYANEKTYTFTKTYSGMELVGIKAQRSQSSTVTLTVSAEDIRSIPIKYFKNFPWLHAVSFHCQDE
jgi:hypothetical protein